MVFGYLLLWPGHARQVKLAHLSYFTLLSYSREMFLSKRFGVLHVLVVRFNDLAESVLTFSNRGWHINIS